MQIFVDGTPREMAEGGDGFGLFEDKSIIALLVNDELKDLAHKLSAGDQVSGVHISSVAARVLAQVGVGQRGRREE